jgi:hypothetical protein
MSWSIAAGLALSALSPAIATADPATCYTTEDGEYPCEFHMATDGTGSFEITAPGKPWFSLIIESPGVASGYGDYGSGSIPLPGTFYRSEDDGACWMNYDTDFEICAW